MSAVLVTGASGYIGSHTCFSLLKAGHDVIGVDNLSNSHRESIVRVEKLSGRDMTFYECDVRDTEALNTIASNHDIRAVIHFAAFKCVGEAVAEPLSYYHNNIGGLLSVLQLVADAGIHEFVFSSSATVYGAGDTLPFTEDTPLGPTNPYGHSKLMGEQILRDFQVAYPKTRIALLRYFNPVGAHESGEIGEDPNGVPNNLMPYIAQIAVGKRASLTVFGDDYDTPDGTGIRDYLHVMDLAEGHVDALGWTQKGSGVLTVNLATGRGYSVLEVIQAFEEVSGASIAYDVGPRRAGDIPASYADPSRAQKELGWSARRSLKDMCQSMWLWQQQNPGGYSS